MSLDDSGGSSTLLSVFLCVPQNLWESPLPNFGAPNLIVVMEAEGDTPPSQPADSVEA